MKKLQADLPSTSSSRLEVDLEQMRADGYAAVDTLVDHLSSLGDRSIGRVADRSTLDVLLGGDPPDVGRPFDEVLKQTVDDVFGNSLLCNHPRYFAFVPGPSNYYGVLADALAAGFNVFTGTWLESSGPAVVEAQMIDWLRRVTGLPGRAGGLFVSGGSVANLTGLAVARHAQLNDKTKDAVIYCSDQIHASIDKAAFLIGFNKGQLRRLPSDAEFRLDPQTLRHAISEDRSAGRRPFCVVANAGTTNTGAVDPLNEIADICEAEGMWLHVDGAYGASAIIGSRSVDVLAGLGRADSLVLDPHKWLFQPFEIGAVLVRDKDLLTDTFHVNADYMQDTHTSGDEINYCDQGVQLSRGFRALKLWLTLQCFGLDAVSEAIDRGIELAEIAEARLRRDTRFDVVSPATLGVVTFRYVGCGSLGSTDKADMTKKISRDLLESGYAVVTSTALRGQSVLRLCTINPRTTDDDVLNTIERMAEAGDRLVAENDRSDPAV